VNSDQATPEAVFAVLDVLQSAVAELVESNGIRLLQPRRPDHDSARPKGRNGQMLCRAACVGGSIEAVAHAGASRWG
jgi:hypothetical protein